ncbi:hypothetical protein DY000_02005265 [Brassica cretica]|uniref:Uncharacterized protein n=1 Tax=Brassica cretica TaxID=69181 RepID=A0ABQ7CIJ9_BRACR|nr:hypothetical protein DY000_02005265 [Brassica cretica]
MVIGSFMDLGMEFCFQEGEMSTNFSESTKIGLKFILRNHSTISFVACIPIDVATESVWLDLDKNAGSSDFQTWVAHDRRRSRPLATSSVENPRSIAGKTRSETPPSFALAEEHGDNEERNSYGRNGILGKAWRPHDGGGDRRKNLTVKL